MIEKFVPRKDLLDPKDLQLLVGPVEKLAKTKEAPVVPWLRRTEYISSERASFGRNRADARFIYLTAVLACLSKTNRRSMN